jgi:hypothetical protein
VGSLPDADPKQVVTGRRCCGILCSLTEARMAEGSGGASGPVPEGEALRRALRWLDERVREEPGLSRAKLVGEAGARFDLTPLEEEFLHRNWAAS